MKPTTLEQHDDLGREIKSRLWGLRSIKTLPPISADATASRPSSRVLGCPAGAGAPCCFSRSRQVRFRRFSCIAGLPSCSRAGRPSHGGVGLKCRGLRRLRPLERIRRHPARTTSPRMSEVGRSALDGFAALLWECVDSESCDEHCCMAFVGASGITCSEQSCDYGISIIKSHR